MAIQSNFPAIKPSLLLDFANTKQLDPRITFTRASTATYYDGVTTAMAEQNLLTYSQEFDNASWGLTATAITRTANTTTAPDGTTTADSATGDGTTAVHYFGQSITLSSTSTYAFSFYAKANGLNFVQIFLAAGSSFANFDLTSGAGATGTSGGQFGSLAIQDAGSGWYRCSLVMTNPSHSNIYFCLSNSASAARGPSFATSAGVFLWGAQLEQRSAVTAYTATTTQPITNYIPVLKTAASGVARFDHSPTTDESLGLLIEEQRTNLFTYSSDFSNAIWTKTGSTITTDTIVAPDGTLTGDKLVESATTAVHKVAENSGTVTSGGVYTFSVYAKAAERNFVVLQLDSTLGTGYAFFNLSTGAVATTANLSGTPSITSVGNGWYRCVISDTTTATTTQPCIIYVSNADGVTLYAGDGYSGIYIWGAQLEAGAFATSYIPTVASQVTRSADAASMTGTNFSSWYSAGEGTLYVEAALYALPTQDTIFFRMYSSTNEDIQIYYSTPGFTRLYIQDNASTVVSIVSSSSTVQANTFLKQAAAFKTNDAAFSVNGALIGTDSVFTMPDANTMAVGSRAMYVRKATYYPLRVTNAQLQALTS